MSRIPYCPACASLKHGVKTRIAQEHTCGLERGEIPTRTGLYVPAGSVSFTQIAEEKVTAEGLGIKIGTLVKRVDNRGQMKEWEVTDIDENGECISIENETDYLYIMADDCEVVETPEDEYFRHYFNAFNGIPDELDKPVKGTKTENNNTVN